MAEEEVRNLVAARSATAQHYIKNPRHVRKKRLSE